MAEVMFMEGETIEIAYKRFSRKVAKEGTLSLVRQRSSFLSPSQRKRIKSKKAQKRQRRLEKNLRKFQKPNNWKDYSGWENDTSWPISLQSTNRIRRPRLRTEEQEVPTAYAGCLIEYTANEITGLIVVKNKPEDEGASRWGFPGGSIEDGENPADGGVRESFEETGLVVVTSDSDLVYREEAEKHIKYFYKARAVSGSPVIGDEIEEIRLMSFSTLKKIAEIGGLRPSHKTAFLKFLETKGAQCTV